MASQSCTIGGSGTGTIVTFVATGSPYSLNYVNSVVGGIDGILSTGGTVTDIGPSGGQAFFPGSDDGAQSEPIYVLVPDTTTVASQTFNITSAGYVVDTIGGEVTVNLDSAGGDSVIVVGTQPATTVDAAGGDGNLIVFIDGNNVFNGSTTGDGTTVVGGTGNDTINTGDGTTTVNAGDGYDLITLNDTGTGAYNDSAYLDTGYDSVIADGTGDLVVATTEYITVTGGADETSMSSLTVNLLANNDGTANGYDQINGGAGYLTVLDASDANTINGGDGGLTFIGGTDVSATINFGNSTALIFGNTGDNLTLGNVTGDTGGAIVVAAGGNETLNGAGATSALYLFGAAPVDASGAVDVLVGGAGNDTLVAGGGDETLTGGAGANTFLIDGAAAAGASLTISDFGGSDQVAFSTYTSAEVDAGLAGGQEVGGSFVATFSDGTDNSTTVTFTGVSGEGALSGHIITF